MFPRTTWLYESVNKAIAERQENRKRFLAEKKRLEAYRGSPGYEKDLERAMTARKKADAATKAKYQQEINDTLRLMQQANHKRGLSAPTDEQLRLLTALSSMKRPPLAILDAAANSFRDCPVALAALDDMRKATYEGTTAAISHYTDLAEKELAPEAVDEALKGIASFCQTVLNGEYLNVRGKGAYRNHKLYGGNFDPDDYNELQPFSTEQDFYMSVGSDDPRLFCAAVNGE